MLNWNDILNLEDLNYRHILSIIIPLLPVPLIPCLHFLYSPLCTTSWLEMLSYSRFFSCCLILSEGYVCLLMTSRLFPQGNLPFLSGAPSSNVSLALLFFGVEVTSAPIYSCSETAKRSHDNVKIAFATVRNKLLTGLPPTYFGSSFLKRLLFCLVVSSKCYSKGFGFFLLFCLEFFQRSLFKSVLLRVSSSCLMRGI